MDIIKAAAAIHTAVQRYFFLRFFQQTAEFFKFLGGFLHILPKPACMLLNGQSAEAHMQGIKKRAQRGGAHDRYTVFSLQLRQQLRIP